ncbi:unnamed protein product [Darwinula stevensoni]|uniref:Beta-glucosidase n=1 Tax=Darwinula stevensoni TaxID=69355 RepID=A0A7R9A5R7_9CRUS|nr:unnamed protein product [Darwinula stevensoni]CAG0894932.1 unnamed protein product [Darwinula stevensoni]
MRFLHNCAPDCATGGVACDSYHKYQEDVMLLVEMEVDRYRFSISWPRILPDGTAGNVNQAGIDYYNNLIDALVANGIEPLVTLYHWDLPQALEDRGGWLNPESQDWFVEYARICFEAFGDRAKLWITFTQPWEIAWFGYGDGHHAPGHSDAPGEKTYQAGHNILLAHAKTYRMYQEEFFASQGGMSRAKVIENPFAETLSLCEETDAGGYVLTLHMTEFFFIIFFGRVTIALNINHHEPANPADPADAAAASRRTDFMLGWFADPVYFGDYPQSMIDKIGEKSEAQGYPESRLPAFTAEEQEMLAGSSDFFALNFYTSTYVRNFVNDPECVSYACDSDTEVFPDPSWKLLNYIKNRYGNLEVIITENGSSDRAGNLDDALRIYQLKHYINNILKGSSNKQLITFSKVPAMYLCHTPRLLLLAILLDGCNVTGYTAFSLMDSLEWPAGFSEKFGLHFVDFEDPERPRTPKASSRFFRQLIRDNGFLHNCAPDCDTGDVACDSYHKMSEDVMLLVDMEVSRITYQFTRAYILVDRYRFSISWPRILPAGTGDINQAGIDYYNDLIDALIAEGIEPMVTLYHWDLPQALEDRGGWLSPESHDWFVEYARVCFEAFGDRAKLWITFNEPWVVAWMGYGTGGGAPGHSDAPGEKTYQAGRNILLAHAKTYRMYQEEFFASQGGRVGITLNTNYHGPLNPADPEDVAAAARQMEFDLGWFADPVYFGNYPQTMIDKIGEKSEAQGYPESRLPAFTAEEQEMLAGSSDFFGLNTYTSSYANNLVHDSECVSYACDSDTQISSDPSWYGTGSDWLKLYPQGMRKLLNYIKDRYGNPEVIITENGSSDRAGNLDDALRIYQLKHYINNILKGSFTPSVPVLLDGCNVTGYTAWSLMDNLEWSSGFSQKFGLHFVDFEDPERPRTPKASSRFFRQLIRDNGFIEENLCEY